MKTRPMLVRCALSALFVPLAFLAATGAHAQVALQYVDRLGFTDPAHTRADSFQSSTVVGISDTGYTVGASQRFASTSHADQTAWMGSPLGDTTAIGFYDPAHTASIGRHFSRVVKFSKRGHAIGLSARYDGTLHQTGRTAWLATWAGGTRRIGLYADDPTPLPGVGSFNDVVDVNDAGQSIGITPFADGQHAWVADANGNTRVIGSLNPAHQSSGFAPYNVPVALNSSGTVIGEAQWDNGSGVFEENISQVAWLQSKNGGPSQIIGLYGAAYQKPTSGQIFNSVVCLNDRGFVAGTAQRSAGGGDMWLRKPSGETIVFANESGDYVRPVVITHGNLLGYQTTFASGPAWIYDIDTGTTREVGIIGDPRDETPHNYLIDLTEDGVALGGVSGFRGDYYWLAATDGTTRLIGFYGVGYEWAAPGAVFTDIIAMASNGLVIGTSDLQAAGGVTAWVASPVTLQTYRIGLYDGIYAGALTNGFVRQTSIPTHLTSSRFVAGYSLRYHYDNIPEGQTAWVYNSSAGRYAKFVFSVRASDGYAYSRVNRLLERGIAVGTYTKFADDGTDLGDRAFVWVTGKGAFDIGENLDVDPETVDWDYLADAVVANEAGFIAGHGVPFDSTSQGVFLVKLQD